MCYERYSLAYHAEKDADVIAWLNSQDNVTDAIRQLVRGQMPRDGWHDELRAILREELAILSITSDIDTPSVPGDVDPEAGDLLDAMF